MTRSKDKVVSDAMEEIYNYLDGQDDCQYSVGELMEWISGEKLSPTTLVVSSVSLSLSCFYRPLATRFSSHSVTCEPGGKYAGHVIPASRTGSDIAKCILHHLEDNVVDVNELEAIGCMVQQQIQIGKMALSATYSGSYAYFTPTSYHSNIYLNIWTLRQWDQRHFLEK
ncbi:hypothetical protein AVEN_267753-1 [Araneus ventricosus]|uniref:Uncharacterized protein n=1 Tax=Araneus ventricosus TaxID=182803 RepID=A0A4Y2UTL9_ARAVE|nr:hypothetical protein AVEN_267753-1 [Araneus ventricosus]